MGVVAMILAVIGGNLRTSLQGILDEIPDGIFVGAATNILLDFLGTNLEVHGQAL